MSDSIYKKLTNALFKLSGTQAMPKAQWTDISFTNNTYTAPYACYLKIGFNVTIAENPWFNVYITNGISMNLPCVGFVNAQSSVFIPLKKGDQVNLLYYGCEISLSQIFPLVGGGLTAFLRQFKFWEVAYA